MNYFCTYFDKNFLPQGISLYNSLKKTCKDYFVLYVLCLDDYTFKILSDLKLEGVKLLSESDVLEFDERLVKAKNNRPRIEYYYCFTPNLIRYLILTEPNLKSISYIDADMFFFNSIENTFQAYKHYDILLIGHNAKNPIENTGHGIFNVCFNFFINNENSCNAINWWSKKTIESTRLGDGVWGDQKYLDEFPRLFKNVGIIKDYGFATAPWNVMKYNIIIENEKLFLNNEMLSCYHYARMLIINEYFFLPIKTTYLSRKVLRYIYLPYMKSLRESIVQIKKLDSNYRVQYTRKNRKALLGSILLGRVFYQSSDKLIRIGINLPILYR